MNSDELRQASTTGAPVLLLSGMRMWTSRKGLSDAAVDIEVRAKDGGSKGNAVISKIQRTADETFHPRIKTLIVDSQISPADIGSSKEDDIKSNTKSQKSFFILPGFIDSHVHFFDGGRRATALNLSHCKSRNDLVTSIRRYIRKTLLPSTFVDDSQNSQKEDDGRPLSRTEIEALNGMWRTHKKEEGGGEEEMVVEHFPWVVGFQWSDVQLGGLPNKHWLDEACRGVASPSDNNNNNAAALTARVPIMLVRMDCHSCVVNSTALEVCGIDSHGPPNPEGGQIDRWAPEEEAGKEGGGEDSTQNTSLLLGEPTGYMREKAIMLIHNKRRQTWNVTKASLDEAYAAAGRILLSNGITSCFSMASLDYDNIKEFEYLMDKTNEGSDNFPLLRMRSVVKVEEIDQLRAFKKNYFDSQNANNNDKDNAVVQPFHNFGTDFLKFGAVKIFSDGSLGSRTAAMLEPYGDLEGFGTCDKHNGEGERSEEGAATKAKSLAHTCPCGTLLSSCEDLHASIATVAENKLQCCTHAIGDRACQVIQDAYETQFDKNKDNAAAAAATSLRCRIEHCQHIASLDEIDRYRRTNTIPSVQPCHLLFDGDHINSGRLGEKRIKLAYALKSMLERGVRPVFGTDWMVAPICPISNILAAVHRRPIQFAANTNSSQDDSSASISTVPVWNAAEKLSVEEALTAYTADAAYGMFMEDVVGHIEEGYFADMVIVDANPFDVLCDDEFKGGGAPLAGCSSEGAQKPKNPINIVATIVGGKVRYISDEYKYFLE